ncbi:MAG: CorA family divalent cation transporter [Patescibacteria group bacterium]
MITTRAFMDQIWIDLNSPTREEVDSLMLTYGIDPNITQDLLLPTPTQYSSDAGKNIYAVLHIPCFKHSSAESFVQEIDFIISKDSLITARYDSIDALHFFAKQVEVSEILNKGKKTHLFFGIMQEIYKSLTNELSYTEDWMEEIEKNIFEGREKTMVFTISNVGRNLLNLKKIIEPHGHVFEFLRESGTEKFGPEFGEQTKTLQDNWRRIMRVVNNQIELMIELRETNNSMLSTKQNEIMKQLTVIGSILLPLTIVSQLFGMSISNFPLKNEPNAFWIILGIMAIVILTTYAYSKFKKWM